MCKCRNSVSRFLQEHVKQSMWEPCDPGRRVARLRGAGWTTYFCRIYSEVPFCIPDIGCFLSYLVRLEACYFSQSINFWFH